MTWPSPSDDSSEKILFSDEKWDILAKLAEGGDYWSKAQDFMKSIHGRELSSISDKQADWYHNIDAALDKELQLKEAKEVWGEDSEGAKRKFEELYPNRRHR